MKKILYIIGICLVFISCERRELTYDYSPYCEIEMNLDWSNLLTKQSDAPNGVSVIFYPVDGNGEMVSLQLHTVENLTVSVREGVYDVLVFNQIPDDFGTLSFSGMDNFSTAMIESVSRDNDWYTLKDGETGVTRKPEYIAAATINNYEVTADMVSKSVSSRATKSSNYEAPQINLAPKVVVSTSYVNVKVNGVHNISSVRASMSNLSIGYNFSEQKTVESTTVHLLEDWSIYKDEGSYYMGGITTEFTTFGLPSTEVLTRADGDDWTGSLGLQLNLVDGETTVETSYEVGSQINIDDETLSLSLDLGFTQEEGDEQVEIENVEPEGSDGSDGAFDAELDDWGEEETVVVPMK